MSAPAELQLLVERFRDNREDYRSHQYNETQLRREFVDPLFELLGWDVSNTRGWAEAYKQVVHEDRVKVGGSSKAPDYSFRVGTVRKFFLETKRPGINIERDATSAYQLRRYAWSAKLPLSILTNFDVVSVYDCRVKPKPGDRASTARLKLIRFDELDERWGELSGLFSIEAINKGAFDRYAAETSRRGTALVDDDFLNEIERWRELLARAFLKSNKTITSYELSDAVQRTIDRIVFLRIAEDRGIEPEDSLLVLAARTNIYRSLAAYFRKADTRYNSGLFHFREGDGSAETLDRFTLSLQIDDKPIKDVIQSLYPPKSPYEFSYIPADILGQVYERFLGKIIRVKGRLIEIDEKPDVKKAGGVYYTPTFVVRYIIERTVGRLLDGKSISAISGEAKSAEPMRILDPACGSGSFLIEVYQALLDWYLERYTEADPARHAQGRRPRIYRGAGGAWRLTIAERKRILTTHVFGVDVDPQAVEVTKLSLLLKVLEGESQDMIANQISFLDNQRVLPDLGANIRCGNSLIEPNFYGLYDPSTLTIEEQHKVNVFSWRENFPDAFRVGGFDVVVGNPPYGATLLDQEKRYLTSTYHQQNYQLDTYLLFMERAIDLLVKRNGLFGMIIPNPWLTNILQTAARGYVFSHTRVDEIVHFTFPVFAKAKATVDTEILLLQKGFAKQNKPIARIIRSIGPDGEIALGDADNIEHDQDRWVAGGGGPINIFLDAANRALFDKIARAGAPLGLAFRISVGMKPYQVGKGSPKQKRSDVQNRVFDAERKLSADYRLYLRGSDITPFAINPIEQRYIRYGAWLAEPRPSANFDAPCKILMRQTGDSLVAAIDRDRFLCMNNMHVLVPIEPGADVYYYLGLLNSTLMNWYYQALNPEMGEALAEVKKTNVERLPAPRVPNAQQKSISVAAMAIEKNLKALREARDERTRRVHQQTLAAHFATLNNAVFDLFRLSTDERAMILETRLGPKSNFAAKMALAETIMREDRDILRTLAK